MARPVLLGALFLLLALAVLTATSMALAEDGKPVLIVDSPAEDDWFTDPDISVEGRLGTTPRTSVYNIIQLGSSFMDGLEVQSGKLVYRVAPYFSEEFDGPTLNLTKWTVYGSSDRIYLQGGNLVLGNTSSGLLPLIVSADGMFPEDKDISWEAEFMFRHGSGRRSYHSEGAGITDKDYNARASHLGTWHRYWETGYRVYGNGASLRRVNTNSPSWDHYVLRYYPETEMYAVYMDSVFLGAIISISSTMIVVRTLRDQGRMDEQFA